MRSAPIGLFYHDDFEKMKMVAIAASLSTHGHPCALAGSLATAYLVSLALHNTNPESMTDMLCHATKPISSEFTAKVMQVVPALNKEPQEAFRVLGEGWVAEESVACALYCFLRSPYDYVQTVLTGANSNGDSDSIACIAGAISGAYNGIGAIPKRWVDHIEKSAILQAAANGLYDLSTKGKKGCFANEN
jgi:ADP-ribosylglycohydrolase